MKLFQRKQSSHEVKWETTVQATRVGMFWLILSEEVKGYPHWAFSVERRYKDENVLLSSGTESFKSSQHCLLDAVNRIAPWLKSLHLWALEGKHEWEKGYSNIGLQIRGIDAKTLDMVIHNDSGYTIRLDCPQDGRRVHVGERGVGLEEAKEAARTLLAHAAAEALIALEKIK